MRKKISSMVAHINSKNRWTIIGWHRHGVARSEDDTEEILSNDTVGHIVYLMPSNMDNLQDEVHIKYDPPSITSSNNSNEDSAVSNSVS